MAGKIGTTASNIGTGASSFLTKGGSVMNSYVNEIGKAAGKGVKTDHELNQRSLVRLEELKMANIVEFKVLSLFIPEEEKDSEIGKAVDHLKAHGLPV